MALKFKYFPGLIALVILLNSCQKDEYSLGPLTAPSEIVINTEIVGQDATHPNGDGSGDVKISISAKNALSVKVDYDANDPLDLVYLPDGTVTKKYTSVGTHDYRITAVAYGKGGTSSVVTKDISVRSDFTPDPELVNKLTGGLAKTWVVDKNSAGHFGVGPWVHDANNGASDWYTPFWYAAAPSEKAGCCNCFYTASFVFAKVVATGTYSLTVSSPDGAFTKTGALAGGLPGIPASGDEGCYSYGGGTSAFIFVPSVSGVPESVATTKTAILLAGNNTYIGYGAVQKEYEILSITDNSLYLRVRGTETGNAWYLKLIPQ
jgi:hypothetical protein